MSNQGDSDGSKGIRCFEISSSIMELTELTFFRWQTSKDGERGAKSFWPKREQIRKDLKPPNRGSGQSDRITCSGF